MDIFAKENIGRNIPCRLEKNGELVVDYVRWTHAMIDEAVHLKIMIQERGILKSVRDDGWKVVEVGV